MRADTKPFRDRRRSKRYELYQFIRRPLRWLIRAVLYRRNTSPQAIDLENTRSHGLQRGAARRDRYCERIDGNHVQLVCPIQSLFSYTTSLHLGRRSRHISDFTKYVRFYLLSTSRRQPLFSIGKQRHPIAQYGMQTSPIVLERHTEAEEIKNQAISKKLPIFAACPPTRKIMGRRHADYDIKL